MIRLNDLNLADILSLQKAHKKGYVCPCCGNGSGEDGTGISQSSKGWHCFKCGAHTSEILTKGLGLQAEPGKKTASFQTIKKALAEKGIIPKESAPQGAAEGQPRNFTRDIQRWIDTIHTPEGQKAREYLNSRGLADSTILGAGLGYCNEHWRSPEGVDFFGRVIIPLNDQGTAFTGRAIDPSTPKGERYRNVGEQVWDNYSAIYEEGEYLFIVEGVLDGLVMLQAGQPTLPLLSASQTDKVIKALEESETEKKIILALDKDNRGKLAESQLATSLKGKGVEIIKATIPGEYKDPAEYAAAEPEAFKAWADEAAKRDPYPTALAYLDTEYMEGCKHYTEGRLETGWDNLDDEDNGAGGLYTGLYVLGAGSSMGKTTWAIQLAAQVAERGHKAVYISIEQSKRALLTKTLSRLSFEKSNSHRETLARTNKDIIKQATEQATKGAAWYAEHNQAPPLAALQELFKQSIGDNLRIIDSTHAMEMEGIWRTARKLRDRGALDILIVDYLQIIRWDKYKDDKQRLDNLTAELKKMSNDLDIPIVALSSLSRAAYTEPVSQESFKESGGIDYGVDCQLGLYPAILDSMPSGDKAKGRRKQALERARLGDLRDHYRRDLFLNCCKQREARFFPKLFFSYYPGYDCFQGESIDKWEKDRISQYQDLLEERKGKD